MERLNRFADWWERIPLPWHKWRVVVCVEAGDEIPTELPVRGAALVSGGGHARWLAFDCPCGKGHRIMLNLDPVRRPAWRLVCDVPLTVSPSIDDRGIGRRCHFFLHRGQIQWAWTRGRTRR